jgi:hypothetical protein
MTETEDVDDVNVEVRDEDIVIISPGTDHLVIYSKCEGSVQLRARKLFGPLDFRVRAWTLANQKAQELGWSKPDFRS